MEVGWELDASKLMNYGSFNRSELEEEEEKWWIKCKRCLNDAMRKYPVIRFLAMIAIAAPWMLLVQSAVKWDHRHVHHRGQNNKWVASLTRLNTTAMSTTSSVVNGVNGCKMLVYYPTAANRQYPLVAFTSTSPTRKPGNRRVMYGRFLSAAASTGLVLVTPVDENAPSECVDPLRIASMVREETLYDSWLWSRVDTNLGTLGVVSFGDEVLKTPHVFSNVKAAVLLAPGKDRANVSSFTVPTLLLTGSRSFYPTDTIYDDRLVQDGNFSSFPKFSGIASIGGYDDNTLRYASSAAYLTGLFLLCQVQKTPKDCKIFSTRSRHRSKSNGEEENKTSASSAAVLDTLLKPTGGSFHYLSNGII